MKNYKTYFNWSASVLLGLNPTASDYFLNENFKEIKEAANELLNEIEYIPTTIFRGILLQERLNDLILFPHKNFTYLSFTENKEIAYFFADPEGFGRQYGINYLLGNNGYVIEYVPKVEEILFHYNFLEILPYKQVFEQAGITGTDKTFEIQKEVTIIQPPKPLTVIEILKPKNIYHAKQFI